MQLTATALLVALAASSPESPGEWLRPAGDYAMADLPQHTTPGGLLSVFTTP